MLDKTEAKKKGVAKLVQKGMVKIGPFRSGDPLKLDIGCGERKQEGHIGIDIAPCPGVDHVMDVRKTPWPIDSESVDAIWCSHFFEHLDGPERISFMEECWRVMKLQAQMTIIVPYWSSMRAVGDPFHKWPPVCEWTFLYFNEDWIIKNKLTHYNIRCNFNWGSGHIVDGELAARSDDYRQMAIKHYVNSVNDLHVTLTKIEMGKTS